MRVRWRTFGRWLSNLFIAVGLLILVGTGVLYGYSRYEEAQAAKAAALIVPDTPVPLAQVPTSTPTMAPTAVPPTPTISEVAAEWARQIAERRDAPTPTATATPLPTATPIPIFPAERIVATSIKLDSKVVESKIVNGEWQVPKFVAGHLQGTPDPLQGGNVVLCGHIDSISSGDVFAHIGKLKPGDVIQIYTKATIVKYKVAQLVVVPNNDLAIVQPHPQETLTLITCTGTWLPLQHDFDRRLVVIADRVS